MSDYRAGELRVLCCRLRPAERAHFPSHAPSMLVSGSDWRNGVRNRHLRCRNSESHMSALGQSRHSRHPGVSGSPQERTLWYASSLPHLCSVHSVIRTTLKLMGLYWRGRKNAEQIQVRYNHIRDYRADSMASLCYTSVTYTWT